MLSLFSFFFFCLLLMTHFKAKFIDENKSKVKHFGMLKHYEDSKHYLQENSQLVCEDTANYLVVWCIDLEIEEKHELMEHVAHQCIVMQFILELSKTLKHDPRACVGPFFSKMQLANREYKDGFYEELNAFKARIRKRAQEKIEQAMKEAEEEERQKRLGPGGLDPVEVFESLPVELQKCFESQDIALLQETILKMNSKDAEYFMDRCVKSGLWVPEGGKKTWKAEESEEVYEEISTNNSPANENLQKKSVTDDVD
jgi:cell division cycle protein 37